TAGFASWRLHPPAGLSCKLVQLLVMAGRVLVVTSFEPTAVVDAYAVIKILTSTNPTKEVGLVVNAARDGDEAGLVFRQLDIASSRFLRRGLRYYGFIVQDAAVPEAVRAQRAVVDHVPQAPASRCFRILAARRAGMARGGGRELRLAHRNDNPQDQAGSGEEPRCA